MTHSKNINTLSEFLLQAQTQYLLIDLGRGMRLIDNQTFFEWENQQAPCAYPRQDHAWFCIVFWNELVDQERYMWFIKLPVDENGLLVQASRNQFLEIIVTALGSQLEHTANEQAQLPENPYIFTPSQQQLADCNALIRRQINDNSRDNSKAIRYMQAPSIQEWQDLSVQDIADYIHSIQADDNCQVQMTLAQNLPQYPAPVLTCIFSSLEGVGLNTLLVQAILDFHQTAAQSPLSGLCLRAISYTKNHDATGAKCLINDYIAKLIRSNDPLNTEALVIIAGRYWLLLNEHDLLLKYMHKVAKIDNSYALFHGIYTDLVKVPRCRASMLALLRNSDRSEAVAKGIGLLFQA